MLVTQTLYAIFGILVKQFSIQKQSGLLQILKSCHTILYVMPSETEGVNQPSSQSSQSSSDSNQSSSDSSSQPSDSSSTSLPSLPPPLFREPRWARDRGPKFPKPETNFLGQGCIPLQTFCVVWLQKKIITRFWREDGYMVGEKDQPLIRRTVLISPYGYSLNIIKEWIWQYENGFILPSNCGFTPIPQEFLVDQPEMLMKSVSLLGWGTRKKTPGQPLGWGKSASLGSPSSSSYSIQGIGSDLVDQPMSRPPVQIPEGNPSETSNSSSDSPIHPNPVQKHKFADLEVDEDEFSDILSQISQDFEDTVPPTQVGNGQTP